MASPSPLLSGFHRSPSKSTFLPSFQIRKTPTPNPNPSFKLPPISAAAASSDQEEFRWLREEQRWLREEKRWFREESRWRSEREALIREIVALRVKIDALECGKGGLGVDEAPIERIADVKARPVLVEEELKEMVFEEVRVLEGVGRGSDGEVKERRTLRKGSEGDEVRAMQTGSNGAPTASISEITEIKQTVIKETGDTEFQVSEHRVFLLGENRWEEPSRLKDRDKPTLGSKVVAPTKCLTCRGEGRLMCTECDATGEPNIEEQFIKWVHGAKCPYCEGLGYTTCDVCEGNTIASHI